MHYVPKPIDPLMAYQPPFRNKASKKTTEEEVRPKKVYSLEFIF
jgi:hypothetical protein